MYSKFRNKLMFTLRNHTFIKKILRKPLLFIRYCRGYSFALKLSVQIERDIADLDNNKKTIWYFCAPVHANLGDLAQYYCIHNWLIENYVSYNILQVPAMGLLRFKKRITKLLDLNIKESDVFVFQSGYTMADEHPDDAVRLLILSRYKNPCIIFPQTILYKNKKRYHEIKELLEKRDNLLLLARDNVSYQFALEKFPKVKCLLFPDVVTTLIGSFSDQSKRDGIALCLRNDGEKFYSDEEINRLHERLIEWGRVEVTDTECSDLVKINKEIVKEKLMSKIESFASYRFIITDRYHGTILSLIAGTPVIVIKTRDHKLSSGVHWFKSIYQDFIYYCESLEDIDPLLRKELRENNELIRTRYFKENYYDRLKLLFEKVLQGAENVHLQ